MSQKWSRYKTAAGALKARFSARAGYIFSTLLTDQQRIAYLTATFPNMPGNQVYELLEALRNKWNSARTLQYTWDAKFPPKHGKKRI